MPELPEVETVKNTLLPKVQGRIITGVEVFLPRLVKIPDLEQFTQNISARRIETLTRRGKYLIFHLSGDYLLIFHLRMTGRLLYLPATEPVVKHTHVIFQLDNGDQLRFHDLRTFGTIYLVKPQEKGLIRGLASLGPEPLSVDFTPDYLHQALAKRKVTVKGALLNQELVAGLGNIYVDEALFHAGIHPARPAGDLTDGEVKKLHQAIQRVLQEGIRHRGTSIRDYVDGEGNAGGFQTRLAAYGRRGQPCARCGVSLEGVRLAGRSSVFCPRCQT